MNTKEANVKFSNYSCLSVTKDQICQIYANLYIIFKSVQVQVRKGGTKYRDRYFLLLQRNWWPAYTAAQSVLEHVGILGLGYCHR